MIKRRGPLMLLRTSRKARWALAILATLSPVLYLASFGPVCWISSHRNAGGGLVVTVYKPIFVAIFRNLPPTAPQWTRAIHAKMRYYSVRYLRFGAKDGWDATCWPVSLSEFAYAWGPVEKEPVKPPPTNKDAMP